MMKSTRLLLLGAAIATLSFRSAPSDGYRVVHGWPKLPEGRILGQATGVGVDSHDHVFVFHRADREWSDTMPPAPIALPTVEIFDGATGEHLGRWGAGMFSMPHGLAVDGEDNIWLTDVGSHQVFKCAHDGRLLMTLGTKGVPGDDSAHFNLPTDVAVLPNGNFYVSDGYGNARVAEFSPNGGFLGEWGTKGSGPGQFNLPHGIAVDRDGNIYVADRSNARLEIFRPDRTFREEWKGDALGRPYGVSVGADSRVYVVDGGDQPASPPDRSKAHRLSPLGEIESTFGSFGNYDGQFVLGHDIAVGPDGAVYVVDAWGKRVQKFTPH